MTAILDLLPPPTERVIPTARERLIASQGGAAAVAAATGRVVVEQADGSTAIVPPEKVAEARDLAARGKLAELVNGPGTSPKPRRAAFAVVARDERGVEIRTVLVATAEQALAALACQHEQGLRAEVVPATEATLFTILRERLRSWRR